MNINTYELISKLGSLGCEFDFIKNGEFFYIVAKDGNIPHDFECGIGTLANVGGYKNAWEIHEGDLA